MILDSMAGAIRKDKADAERERFAGLSWSVQKIDAEFAAPIVGQVAAALPEASGGRTVDI